MRGGVKLLINPPKDKVIDFIETLEREVFSDNPYSRETIELFWKEGAGVIVAVDGEDYSGYLLYKSVLDEMNLERMAVVKEKRRRGVALSMIAKLVEIARSGGYRRIILQVRRSNIPAISLYRKAGFRSSRIRRRYFGEEDGVEMVMNLGEF